MNKEELEKLEAEGYSCGDCERLEACRSLGVNEFGFLCFSFTHPNAPAPEVHDIPITGTIKEALTPPEAGDSSKVVITEPGMVKAIDGKEYYNPSRIIAGSPADVEAWHRENATPGGSFADAYYTNQAEIGLP